MNMAVTTNTVSFRGNSTVQSQQVKYESTKTLLLSTGTGAAAGGSIAATGAFLKLKNIFKKYPTFSNFDEFSKHLQRDFEFGKMPQKLSLEEQKVGYENMVDIKNFLMKEGVKRWALIGLAIGAVGGLVSGAIVNHVRNNKPSTPPPVETPQEPPKPQQNPVEDWSAFSLKG